MSRTFTTRDGVKLRTSSTRRFVTFRQSFDGGAWYIVKRTDNPHTAQRNHAGPRVAVTVDYVGGKALYGNESRWQ